MDLKFTKNQVLILEFFFNDPEKSCYLRELARFLGKQPGVFQKDINRLVEKGILTSEFIGKSRFFCLDKRYPIYKELKSIFFKTVGIEAQLKFFLAKLKDIEVAFIFGSFARGGEDSFSDVDLMIIGDPDEDKLIEGISEIENHVGREINYHIYTSTDWTEKIKEKGSFIENVTKKPKIFLIGNYYELSGLSKISKK